MISELCVYPLKSGRGIDLEQAQIDARGILWDREMMLVSGSGKFITQRQFPQLAKVRVQISKDRVVFQSADSPTDLTLDLKFLGNDLIEVEIWGDRTKAIDLGELAAQWFHRLLNLPTDRICRLVKQSPNHVRLLNKKYPQDEEQPLGFADNTKSDLQKVLTYRILKPMIIG